MKKKSSQKYKLNYFGNLFTKNKTLKLSISLWKILSRKRKIQILFITNLMIISALAEILCLASVIPFLGILLNPDELWKIDNLNKLFVQLGFNSSEQLINPIILIFCISTILATCLRLLTYYCNFTLAGKIGNDISNKAFSALLNKDLSFHIDSNSSEFVSLVSQHLQRTVSFIASILLLITSSFIIAFSALLISFINPFLAISVLIFYGLIYKFLSSILVTRVASNSKKSAIIIDSQIKLWQESMMLMRDIIINQSQKYFLKNNLSFDIPYRKYQAQNNFIATSPRAVLECVTILIICLIAYQIKTRELSNETLFIGYLGTIVFAVQRILPSFQMVFASWSNITNFYPNAERVIKIISLNKKSNKKLNKNIKRRNFNLFKNLELKNVSFKYNETENECIESLNFYINSGDKIAIIGETGSGKSTLMDLLLGFKKPTGGKILINGRELRIDGSLSNLENWHKLVSIVPQEIFLIDDTIANNISLAQENNYLNLGSIRESAKIACIDDFIINLPKGYKTIVGENGVKLSGGQRQRIGIARAIFKGAKVIFLDEATSDLDKYTEERLMQSLFTQNNEITLISITHRLDFINYCNKVIDLNKL